MVPPSQTIGLYRLLFKKCLNDDFYLCHDKGVLRDFLYIDDLLNLLLKIFNKKDFTQISGQIFNVGYGKGFDLNLVAKKLRR